MAYKKEEWKSCDAIVGPIGPLSCIYDDDEDSYEGGFESSIQTIGT